MLRQPVLTSEQLHSHRRNGAGPQHISASVDFRRRTQKNGSRSLTLLKSLLHVVQRGLLHVLQALSGPNASSAPDAVKYVAYTLDLSAVTMS